MQVWLSLHTADENANSSHQQYCFISIQLKHQGHSRTSKKKHITKPLRLEGTKSHSLGSNNPIQNYSSVTELRDTVTMGTCPASAWRSAHAALVTGHPTSQRSSLLFSSNSAAWKDCQLYCFGLPCNQQAYTATREAHREGKLFLVVMSNFMKDKGRLALKIQVQATVIVIHRPQRPEHELLSALSSATLHSATAAEQQVLQILFLLKVQKHQ